MLLDPRQRPRRQPEMRATRGALSPPSIAVVVVTRAPFVVVFGSILTRLLYRPPQLVLTALDPPVKPVQPVPFVPHRGPITVAA